MWRIISFRRPHPSLSVSYSPLPIIFSVNLPLSTSRTLSLFHFLQWSVAVSIIRHQRTRSLAFFQAESIPMFADCTSGSASIPLSQVVHGRPRGPEVKHTSSCAPNGVLPCWWYVIREHDRWSSSKLSGYRCLPTVHRHQSPSARW